MVSGERHLARRGRPAYHRRYVIDTGAATGYSHRALLVGDGQAIDDAMRVVLADHGFAVESEVDPEDAVANAPVVDVIVLDVAAPTADPIDICRRLRSTTNAYIVAVGERRSELDAVLSLSVGADDFMPQPVRTAELMARVQAMLRRPRYLGSTPNVLQLGDLEIDTGRREVRVAGEAVTLSGLEFGLLETLARNPRLTLSRQQLLEQVWGPSWFGDDHVIDVHMSNLRRKLGDDPQRPRFIRTVRGFGFRIVETPPD